MNVGFAILLLLTTTAAQGGFAVDTFLEGSTFHGQWRALVPPPNFEHSYGSLVFRLDTFPTSLPQWQYVQALLLIRDGQYADQDVDLRFRLHGVFLPFAQEAFLFTHEDWQSDAFLSFLSHSTNSTEGARDALAALLVVQSKLLLSRSLRKPGEDTTVSKCDLLLQLWASGKNIQTPMYAITSISTNVTAADNHSLTPVLFNHSGSPNQVQGNVSSGTCGFLLDLEASTGGRAQHFSKGTHYCYLGILIASIQIYHTIKQMAHANSHSSASQVAIYTIYLQALLDAYIYFFHIVIAVVVEPIRNSFVMFAFCDFVAFSLIEMRFLFLLWRIQYPDAFASGGERMHREFGVRYARFYGSLLLGLLCMQWGFLLKIGAFVLSSFWVPQIIHNVQNDLKKPLLPSYIITMSLSRLFLPLYLWGCPVNFFNVAPNPWQCMALVCYISLQAGVLFVQMSSCGPRFMIPARFLPVKYTYHRAVPLQRIECKDSGGGSEPCAICYNEFDQPYGGNIMVTPCDHVFHSECLLRWMEQKMQCPTCRFEPLPVP